MTSLADIYHTLLAFQNPLLLLLTIFGPSLLPRAVWLVRRILFDPPPSPTPTPTPRARPRRSISPAVPASLKVFLLLHTIWHAYHLLRPPYNVFTTHSLPLLAPNEVLRSALLSSSAPAPNLRDPTSPASAAGLGQGVHPHPLLELLLARLKALDMRYAYARFGHAPLLTCVWCTNTNDFLLASLPRTMGVWLVESVLLGLVTSPSGTGTLRNLMAGAGAGKTSEGKVRFDDDDNDNRWKTTARGMRKVGTWALGLGFTAELAVKAFWDVRAVRGDCLHLASTVHTIRTLSFLLLPFILYLLPCSSSPSGSNTNLSAPDPQSLMPLISNTTSTLRLTSLARQSLLRDPGTCELLVRRSEAEQDAAKRARADERVSHKAQEVGMGTGAHAERIREWVTEGWEGMIGVRLGGESGGPS